MGPQGLLVLGLPAPFVPHSASLSPATATRVLSTPVPVFAPPTSLDECLFSISLVSVPLAVRFSFLVVRGGAVCQPTPPSSVSQKFFGCDGVMMLRRIAHGRRGARGALMQVSAASAAPLPSRPRGRGMSAALDLRLFFFLILA